jgi:hypothetical protein
MKIAWVHPHCRNINVGSFRLQTLIPHQFLLTQGVSSVICQNVDEAFGQQPDVVVCMQIADTLPALERRKSVPTTAVIGFQSDGPVVSAATLDALDGIVVDASMLLFKIPMKHQLKTVHIPTALEIPMNKYKPHTHPGRMMRYVYVGAMGNLHFGLDILRALQSHGYPVEIITDDPAIATIPWNVETYADDINQFDVAVVPYPPDLQVDPKSFTEFFYKDPSRPTLFQAIGLPVVCSPLPSYLQYIQPYKTGLFANRMEEWFDRLDWLQTDDYGYASLARQGWEQSWKYANPELVGRAWKNLIDQAYLKSHKPV